MNNNQFKISLREYVSNRYKPIRRVKKKNKDIYTNYTKNVCLLGKSINKDSSIFDNYTVKDINCCLKDVLQDRFKLDCTFQQQLFYHIDSKKLDEVEVYKKAHIDRKLFSKIRSDINYRPSKSTTILFCFGLKLNIDESLDLLMKAGYTLSNSNYTDVIVRYFLENKEYDLLLLNDMLMEYNQKSL